MQGTAAPQGNATRRGGRALISPAVLLNSWAPPTPSPGTLKQARDFGPAEKAAKSARPDEARVLRRSAGHPRAHQQPRKAGRVTPPAPSINHHQGAPSA